MHKVLLFIILSTFVAIPGTIRAQLSETPTITVRAYTGEQDPNEPPVADYRSFFTPETGAFLSVVSRPKPFVTGTFALQIGGLLSNPNALIASLTQPTGNALLATFRVGPGGITGRDNVALLVGKLEEAQFNEVAQTGTPESNLPTGVTIKKFLTLDGNGTDPFFFATLQGTGVTSSNSLALCSYSF